MPKKLSSQEIDQILANREDLPKWLKTNHPDLWLQFAWEKVNNWRSTVRTQNVLLGDTADFGRELFTLDPKATEMVFFAFEKYWQDNLLYKDSYLVNWSVGLQTAVSDVTGDIEWEMRTDPFVTFYYEITNVKTLSYPKNTHRKELDIPLGYFKILESVGKKISVSTVRQETIAGDVALAVHPSKIGSIFNLTEKEAISIVEDLSSSNPSLEIELKNPVNPQKIKLIIADEVDPNFGTGILKITPASDIVDYNIFNKYIGGEFPRAIGRDGKLTDICGEFAGLTVEQARPQIIKKLIETGFVPKKSEVEMEILENEAEVKEVLTDQQFLALNPEKQCEYLANLYPEYQVDWTYSHNVMLCERSKTVIEPLISEEFFISFSREFEKTNATNFPFQGGVVEDDGDIFNSPNSESEDFDGGIFNSRSEQFGELNIDSSFTPQTLLIATSNPSKVKRYQEQISDSEINLISLDTLDLEIEPPAETGLDCEQIAELKAKYYFEKTKLVCFALDTGLYFEGVLASEQPGKNVKGIAGVDDDTDPETAYQQMIEFYAKLATKYGGELSGYFLDAYCLFDGQKTYTKSIKRPITLTSHVNKKDLHFPICSLYKVNGIYYHDLTKAQMQDFLAESVAGLKELINQWKATGQGWNVTEILEFGQKQDNEVFRSGSMAVVYNPATDLYAVWQDSTTGKIGLAGGGDDGKSLEQTAIDETAEELGLVDIDEVFELGVEMKVHYHHAGKKLNRVATVKPFLIILKSDKNAGQKLEAHEQNLKLTWDNGENIYQKLLLDSEPNGTREHYAEGMRRGMARVKDLQLRQLTQIISTQAKFSDKPFIIGVDGRGGSGKSTLAENLEVAIVNSKVIRLDEFYLPQEKIKDSSLLNYDLERLISEVVKPFVNGEKIAYGRYNWGFVNNEADKIEKIELENNPQILILEGCSSIQDDLEKYLDLKIFIQTSAKTSYQRGKNRDLNVYKLPRENVFDLWKNWEIAENNYINSQNPQSKADLIVSTENGGYQILEDRTIEINPVAAKFTSHFQTTNPKTNLQKLGLEGVSEVQFFSTDYQERAINFLENIKDWCISRDLLWGHKIPVWYNLEVNPEKKFFSFEQIEIIKDRNEILPMIVSLTKPDLKGNWVQEEKILDTWFSSCLWPLSTLGFVDFVKKDVPSFRGVAPVGRRGVFNSEGKNPLQTKLWYNPELKEKAKELRDNSTKAEIRFWSELKNDHILAEIDFHRQKPIDNFIVDFYIPTYNLVVELDGESHNQKVEQDKQRDILLKNKYDLTVLRFLNEDVKNNLDGIFGEIKKYIKTQTIHPVDFVDTPLKEGTNQPTYSTDEYTSKTTDFERFYPTDEMITAKEIFYIWIVRMIVLGKYFTGQIPFKKLIITPTILDEKGRKMSKSLGNGLDPKAAIDKFSSDALRLGMLSGMIPNRNMRMGGGLADKIMEKHRNFNTKLLNVAKFLYEDRD